MDPRISGFNDDQERIWSDFWQIQYSLAMFGIDTKDFTDRSDENFEELIANTQMQIDDQESVKLLDEQLANLAKLLDTDRNLATLRKRVAEYIESVPTTLGCFDMNLLIGPYLEEILPQKLNRIVKQHIAGCPECAQAFLKADAPEL